MPPMEAAAQATSFTVRSSSLKPPVAGEHIAENRVLPKALTVVRDYSWPRRRRGVGEGMQLAKIAFLFLHAHIHIYSHTYTHVCIYVYMFAEAVSLYGYYLPSAYTIFYFLT